MSKRTHNTSTVCEYCSKTFTYYSAPSIQKRQFCSLTCSNKARILPDIPCPICGTMFHPTSWGAKGRKQTCSQSCATKLQYRNNPNIWQHRHPIFVKSVWTPDKKAFLKKYYPTKGATYCAEHLGVTKSAICSQATKIGVRLNEETYYNTVHRAAQAYMSASNPMHNPQTVAKVQSWYIEHPEEHQQQIYKSLKSKRQSILETASDVQEQFWTSLEHAGIEFKKEYLAKPHYLIDAAIPEQMLAIELYGCYWHGHDCRFPKLSERQKEQRQRDKQRDIRLTEQGWTVIHIWECEINSSPTECVERILQILAPHPLTG